MAEEPSKRVYEVFRERGRRRFYVDTLLALSLEEARRCARAEHGHVAAHRPGRLQEHLLGRARDRLGVGDRRGPVLLLRDAEGAPRDHA